MLVIRELFNGNGRFNGLLDADQAPPAILSERLAGLERDGVVDKRPYSSRADRYEYRLTAEGPRPLPRAHLADDVGRPVDDRRHATRAARPPPLRPARHPDPDLPALRRPHRPPRHATTRQRRSHLKRPVTTTRTSNDFGHATDSHPRPAVRMPPPGRAADPSCAKRSTIRSRAATMAVAAAPEPTCRHRRSRGVEHASEVVQQRPPSLRRMRPAATQRSVHCSRTRPPRAHGAGRRCRQPARRRVQRPR